MSYTALADRLPAVLRRHVLHFEASIDDALSRSVVYRTLATILQEHDHLLVNEGHQICELCSLS